MSNLSCPCGSVLYSQCCQPLHIGKTKAQSAEQLMRSRYSAFAKSEIDYIVKTTALGQQQALDVKAIADWSKANQWLKLEIVKAQEKLDKNHAQVEFKAHYVDQNSHTQQVEIHHEISHFVRHENEWYFLDPTTDQQITMKQPCICGSGKKFKQCCAQFL
ncbi:MAG: YchJ family protein [Acinetobacter sp.]